ncbi:hypothetical protein G97194_004751 [Escherichia coli]|nr:terminase small subunit [Escherichia coli]OUF87373.1 hypothetical protein G97194_004751 [Escherichia coli]
MKKRQTHAPTGTSKQTKDKEAVPHTDRPRKEDAQNEKNIQNKKRHKQQHNQRTPEDADEQHETMHQERDQLTKEQAEAQKLKNHRKEGKLIETELCTFTLKKLAKEMSRTLEPMPLTIQRKYPDITPPHLDQLKTQIAKAANQAAKAGEKVPEWIDEYRRAKTK